MRVRLALLFSIVPAIELYLIVTIGRQIGIGTTVLVLLIISLSGAWLVRSQGFRVLAGIRDELASGRLPAEQLVDGAFVLVGGVLLLTPGFFTDVVGMFFLVPLTRGFLKRKARLWVQRRLDRGTIIIRR